MCHFRLFLTDLNSTKPSVGIFTVGMIISVVTAGGLLTLLTGVLITLLALQARRRERKRRRTKKMVPENYMPQRHEDTPINHIEPFRESSVESSTNHSRSTEGIHLTQNEVYRAPSVRELSVESSTNHSRSTEDIHLTQNEAYRAPSVESINRCKCSKTDITDRTYVIPTMSTSNSAIQITSHSLTDSYDYVIPNLM